MVYNGKGRPLEYFMLSISEVAEIHRIVYFEHFKEHLTQEIQSIFDECDQLRTTIHTMYISIKKVEDFFLEEEINQVTVHEQTSARIGKMLVRVWSRNAEQSEFDQLLVELECQVATLNTQTEQFERGHINTKLKYAHLNLKKKMLFLFENLIHFQLYNIDIQNLKYENILVLRLSSQQLVLNKKQLINHLV